MTTRSLARPPSAALQRNRAPSKPSFDLLESRLHAPALRPGIVGRARLIDRLVDAGAPGIISVVAPAGYGKTTLLAQAAVRSERRVAWVTADSRDNDPAVLLTYVAVALDRVERINPAIFRALASPGLAVVPTLVGALAALRTPIVLVIDQAESITNPGSLDAIAELALCMPPGSQLAITSRDHLRLPIARLRVTGGVMEIGVGDLAMGDEEATALLAAAGADLGPLEVHDLVERTEGWPAGLYLAALAMKAGSSQAEAGFRLTGDDRFVGDYLRSELLDRVSAAYVTFLTRSSVLDRMSGPLCDAAVGTTGSSRVLAELEDRNLLVVPLDRRREWYRYHRLLRELLLDELDRREPDAVSAVHSRAATWYEANGMPEAAMEHVQAAGDADRFARLLLNVMQPVWASGRVDTVLAWMEWLEDKPQAEYYGAVAVHGALIFALLGRPGEAERWAAAAERASTTGVLPDGNTMEGSLAYLRALCCRDGVEQMQRDARIVWDGLSPASPYRATMLHTAGMSYLLAGDPDRADQIFARAVDVATSAGALPFVPVVLAARGIVAIDRGDWAAAEAFVDRALKIVRDGHFDHYWTSAVVYVWAARVAMQRGDVTEARQYVARAARLRPLLTYALPVVSAQALLELVRSYIGLDDPNGARAVLRQLQDILQQRPELGDLTEQAAELRAKLDSRSGGTVGASSLTTAELRLLPLLATHLTLAEIGERLYVSRNTVKSQAIAIYRKFGVSSRGATVKCMHDLGLLGHD